MISKVKVAVLKNSDKINLFKNCGSPPQPIVSRWISWLSAALWYSKKLPEVRQIVDNFQGSGILVKKVKEEMNSSNNINELIHIFNSEALISVSLKSEGRSYKCIEAYDDFEKIKVVTDQFNIKQYISKRLATN